MVEKLNESNHNTNENPELDSESPSPEPFAQHIAKIQENQNSSSESSKTTPLLTMKEKIQKARQAVLAAYDSSKNKQNNDTLKTQVSHEITTGIGSEILAKTGFSNRYKAVEARFQFK